MEVGRIAGSTVLEEMRADRGVRPPPEEAVPETFPQKEQCTLHISDAGYRRWELSQENGARETSGPQSGGQGVNIQSPTVDAGANAPSGTVQETASVAGAEGEGAACADRATRLLQLIDARRDMFAHLKPKANKDIDDENVQAMEQLRQLEEEQEAEYRKMEAEAQELAKMRAKTRDTVEKGMRDLTIILESIRPQEEQEEEKAAPSDKKETGEQEQIPSANEGPQGAFVLDDEETLDAREAMQGLGSFVRGHAFRAEQAMDATIERIYENARANFDTARQEDGVLLSQLESVCDVLEAEDASEADKDAAVDRFLKEGKHSLGLIRDYMGYGLERLGNLRGLRVGRLSNQNMVYANRAQENIDELADQSALDGLYQDSFKKLEDKNIDELTERIRKLQENEQKAKETGRKEKEDEAFASGEAEQTEETNEEREERAFL